jgi:DNA-binding response OmpR family regulator
VLLDIRMPGLDGVSVLKRYRKEKMGAQAPVIVVSAFATECDLITYREAGATCSMAKPYELDLLLAAVASLIETSEHTQP